MANTPFSGAAESAASVAAFSEAGSAAPVAADSVSIIVAGDQNAAEDADATAPTRVTATMVEPAPALPQGTLLQSIGLKERQRAALAALTAGKNFDDAARAAGVHIATLYRWKKYDARFIAALNAWQTETERSAHLTLLAAAGAAAAAVLRAAQNGDVRTSLTLLKSLGILATKPAGSALPACVAKELAAEAGLVRQTIAPRPKKVSLRLLEEIFQNMEMDDETRLAYRTAFVKHRSALKAGAAGPLMRPVTPATLQQAALAAQAKPGRAFRYAAEPSLAEYIKYQEHQRQQAGAVRTADSDSSLVPAHLRALPPMPAYPPAYFRITITGTTSPIREQLVQLVAQADRLTPAAALEALGHLPYLLRSMSCAEYVESTAKNYEAQGATVEIRAMFKE